MKARGFGRMLTMVLMAAVAAGCSASAPARFYTLDATATASSAPATRGAILVGPVTIPATVDVPEFVLQVAPNRVELEEFNRWAAPLSDSIARVVAGDLAVLLGSAEVATAPLANFAAAYEVTINVLLFESARNDSATIDAVWTVRRTSNGKTRTGETVAREAVQGDSFDALAAAHSRALAKVSTDIAAAIRVEAGQQH